MQICVAIQAICSATATRLMKERTRSVDVCFQPLAGSTLALDDPGNATGWRLPLDLWHACY